MSPALPLAAALEDHVSVKTGPGIPLGYLHKARALPAIPSLEGACISTQSSNYRGMESQKVVRINPDPGGEGRELLSQVPVPLEPLYAPNTQQHPGR